jgi:hypothetical protein
VTRSGGNMPAGRADRGRRSRRSRARRTLLPLLLALAPCALVLVAGAEAPTPSEQWRERIAAARELKLWIATAATALLLAGLCLRLARRERLLARARDAALVALALATVFAWWHPYRGSLRAWLHVGDSFHYFMGAKYFDELGYTRLYHCAVVADAEAGLGPALARSRIRNLETNAIESAQVALRDPARCQRHFTPERWRSFAEDLAFFREKLTIPLWFQLRSDHGYNAPPTWTLVGGALAAGSADRTRFFLLTAIDPLLIAAMFGALVWAFGWRVAGIALIYWGTNQPASWEWVGGSILRFDWLAASVAAVCCLKRERPVAAGLLLAWAVGVRIFPIVIVVGIGVAAVWRMHRERSLAPTRGQRRLAIAFAAGIAAIAAVTSIAVGPRSWVDFARNSRVHLATDSVNRTGLRPLLAYRHETRIANSVDARAADPYLRWRQERARAAAERWPIRVAVSAGYLVLLALALRRQPDWAAGVLGIGMVPVLLELGSYYFGLLLAFACLARRQPDVGVALMLLAAVSWWLGTWGGPGRDTLVAHTSLAMLVFVGFVTLRAALARNAVKPSPGP